MLRHGLQEMHGTALTTPSRKKDQPDRERLAARYEKFLMRASDGRPSPCGRATRLAQGLGRAEISGLFDA
jgi:hypothetical protein